MKILVTILGIMTLAGCVTTPPAEKEITSVHPIPFKKELHIFFIWPVNGTVSSGFNSKIGYCLNKGIDITADEGNNVKASRGGKVVYRNDRLKGFGKTVIIDHGDNFLTLYSYNSDIVVKTGDVVAQNDVIAKVGRTGTAKYPCLHFEIRKDGMPQNPLNYLSR